MDQKNTHYILECPYCKSELRVNHRRPLSDSVIETVSCLNCKRSFVFYTEIEVSLKTFKTQSELNIEWNKYVERKYKS